MSDLRTRLSRKFESVSSFGTRLRFGWIGSLALLFFLALLGARHLSLVSIAGFPRYPGAIDKSRWSEDGCRRLGLDLSGGRPARLGMTGSFPTIPNGRCLSSVAWSRLPRRGFDLRYIRIGRIWLSVFVGGRELRCLRMPGKGGSERAVGSRGGSVFVRDEDPDPTEDRRHGARLFRWSCQKRISGLGRVSISAQVHDRSFVKLSVRWPDARRRPGKLTFSTHKGHRRDSAAMLTSLDFVERDGSVSTVVDGPLGLSASSLAFIVCLLALLSLAGALLISTRLVGVGARSFLKRLLAVSAVAFGWFLVSGGWEGRLAPVSRLMLGTSYPAVERLRFDLMLLALLALPLFAFTSGNDGLNSLFCSGASETRRLLIVAGGSVALIVPGTLFSSAGMVICGLAVLALLATAWDRGPSRKTVGGALLSTSVFLAGFGVFYGVLSLRPETAHMLNGPWLAACGVVTLLCAMLPVVLGSSGWKRALLWQAILLLLLDLQCGGLMASRRHLSTDIMKSVGEFVASLPRPFSTEPYEADTPKVVVYGGSAVLGVGVDRREARYVSIMGRALRRRMGRPFAAINAGMGGGTTHHVRRAFTVAGHFEKYRPRLIIIVTGFNDTQENRVTYRALERSLRRRDGAVRRLLGSSASYQVLGRFIGAIRAAVRAGKMTMPVPPEHARDNLSKVIEMARRRKVPVLLVSEAESGPVGTGQVAKNKAREKYRRIQANLAQKYGHVGYLDLWSWFRKHGTPKQFIGCCHYSVRGHALVAGMMTEHLLKVWPGREWLAGRGTFASLRREVMVWQPRL